SYAKGGRRGSDQNLRVGRHATGRDDAFTGAIERACDEARNQGLRTLVHAYRDAVRTATLAGCTEIEHGLGASDHDLKLMANKGTYFDPQDGLLIETYLRNKNRYLGTPFSTRRPLPVWKSPCRCTTI